MKNKIKIIPVIMALAAIVSAIPVSAEKGTDNENEPENKMNLKIFGENEQICEDDLYIDENGSVMMEKDFFFEIVYPQIDDSGISCAKLKSECTYYIKNGKSYINLKSLESKLPVFIGYSELNKCVTVVNDPYKSKERLSSYALTLPENAVSYEKAAKYMDEERLWYLYGSNCNDTKTFEDAAVNLGNEEIMQGLYVFPALNLSDYYDKQEASSLLRDVLKETVNETSYDSEHMHVRFIADESSMYKNKGMNRLSVSIRGTFVLWLDCSVYELSASEIEYACRCGFTNLKEGELLCCDADVHMNLQVNHTVSVNSIVSLGKVENTKAYESVEDSADLLWRAFL